MQGLLAGKVAFVTGAGSGIGRATALAMADAGAKVVCLDLDAAATTVAEITAAGGEARSATADVTAEASIDAAIRGTIAAWGRIDCAFNNAGISQSAVAPGGPHAADIPASAWDRVIAINLTGVWTCMRHEIVAMRQSGGGSIVNTASIAGTVGLPGSAAYVASKHGVVGLTKAAAIDHAGDGIRINAVCPGYIDTPMIGEVKGRRGDDILRRVAMGRFGTPEEIAAMVVWLCSDQASFVTGSAMTVDGGYTAA